MKIQQRFFNLFSQLNRVKTKYQRTKQQKANKKYQKTKHTPKFLGGIIKTKQNKHYKQIKKHITNQPTLKENYSYKNRYIKQKVKDKLTHRISN
ncbi:hypothetical protein [Flavobacterium notoginsengisoli]|uniref:hypothetical protein n=1 Tax=Flavobacterium notoginsengisoli TaxID=1478199 RepID=UPI00363CD356